VSLVDRPPGSGKLKLAMCEMVEPFFLARAASQIGERPRSGFLSVPVMTCGLWLALASTVQSQYWVSPNVRKDEVKPDYQWIPPVSRWELLSNTWSTIAGTAGWFGNQDGQGSTARFYQPAGVALDSAGNLYVADSLDHTIRKLSSSGTNWIVSTIAGSAGSDGHADGTNYAARFNRPAGIAVDRMGDLYVADSLNNTIRKVARAGTNWVVTTVAGLAGKSGFADGTNGAARFDRAAGVAVDGAGSLYVTDTQNHTVRKITCAGTNWVTSTLAGTPGRRGSTNGWNGMARFNQPEGIVLDSAGLIYVADTLNGTIRKLRLAGAQRVEVSTIVGQAGTPGYADGTNRAARFNCPRGIAEDEAGSLYVADSGNHIIRKIDPAGTNWVARTLGGWAQTIGAADGEGYVARFYCPLGIAVDRTGCPYYVADSLNNTIREGGIFSGSDTSVPGQWRQAGVSVNIKGRKKGAPGVLHFP
jgi:hypothetical protein